MANRAYLWNTNVLSNNMFALGSTEDGVDIRRVIVAEAVYRVPVPWMCCFRTLDLQIFAPTRADMFGDDEADDGLAIAYERLVPCTTVAEAHRNLAASWPLFAAIALDSNEDPEDDARDKWQDALDALKTLPFPYLTVAIYEVVESEAEHASFVEAMRGDLASVPHLIELSRSHGDIEIALDAGFFQNSEFAGATLPAITPESADNADWQKAWRKLAKPRSKAAAESHAQTCVNLDEYARNGLSAQVIEDRRAFHMFKVPHDAEPAPREWEWNVPLELISYAESLVDEVEAERARGLALNLPLARSAFAAHYTANLICLHRLLLCPMRRCSPDNILMSCDVALYTAFGLVVGCEGEALRSARMLCATFTRPNFFLNSVAPAEQFVFALFFSHFDQPLPELAVHKRTPIHNALLENGRWRSADTEELATLCLAACREYTHIAYIGPFRGIPITILTLFKLREMSGLANPVIDHPLFNAMNGPLPALVPRDQLKDELVIAVRQRMERHGFDERMIYESIVSGAAPSNEMMQPARTESQAPWWKFW